ncbi:DUF6351 family protein [Sphingobium lignivorans]|uniref:Feruloyl esterase n=1 Tax=Sphingobium lignivorans TaxID=2735886 RepID=A0ABR6NC16_9SPHN|nr:DUF6351 family protein [Sphingobium lignivorans]MBB5984821.1 feruloyl esterase [Sphingobium lignivorans]
MKIMRTRRLKSAALLMASAAALCAMPAQAKDTAAPPAAARCEALAGQSFGPDVKILSARHVAATPPSDQLNAHGWRLSSALPGHCRVDGIINERQGAGGKTYGIRYAIAMPDDWQGRFLLQGGGGLNGSVLEPTGPVAANGVPALARGFAVISHDSGHEGAVFDNSFMADQRAALDFAETSVRTATLLGKKVTTAYYGRDIAHSYMAGCSTGGREAMLASQRYPELFDGIIAGAPAMRTGDSNLAIDYSHVLFNQVASKGADGKPDVSALFSDAVRQTILHGLLAQCDGLDGLKDGMIENVAQCRFDPAKLVCKPGQSKDCISAGLAGALKVGFAGPRDKAGYPLYTAMPFDTGIVVKPMGYLPTGAPGPFGPPSTDTAIDLDARIQAIRNDPVQRLTDTNYWTNLGTFLDRGGKMLFFHGVSDFWFSAQATWDYYERAAETNGKAFTNATRFYMVPGMLHCQGGNAFDQFDMLGALVDWVEEGKAPEAIVAARKDQPEETRPLCPYPGHARYVGGDAKKASAFACTPAQDGPAGD